MISLLLFRNPRILLLVISVIVVSGVSALTLLPRLEDPILGKRIGVISTPFPGADAHTVESLVTIKLEQRLRGISEIEQIRSTSRPGISNLVVELDDNVTSVDPVWTTIRNRLIDLESKLPSGTTAPTLEVFPMKAFAAVVAVKPQKDDQDTRIARRLAGELAAKIQNLPGSESVTVYGDPGEEFLAELQAVDLVAARRSTAAIASQVAAANVTHPAGVLESVDSALSLNLDAKSTPLGLGKTLVSLGSDGHAVMLSEIADVKRAIVSPAPQLALIDGVPAIAIGVFVDDHIRVDSWSHSFQESVAKFANAHVQNIEVEVIYAQKGYIDNRFNGLVKSLFTGGAAVVAVIFVMMGWRSMVAVGVALPLSALMVLTGLRTLQIPLHQMSITGLIVALGLLIDNAIVIVDEVRSKILARMPAGTAIVETITHLKMPLFGSTLTTAFAFMPIATLPGPPGEFVGTIAVSVILAIGSSFLLAMTVVPAILALMRVDAAGTGVLGRGVSSSLLARIYEWSLSIVFRFPILGVILGLALPITGFMVAKELPEQFFPPSDRSQIQIEVELAASARIEKTLATVSKMHDVVTDHDSARRAHWFVGSSAPTFYYNVVPRRRNAPYYAQAIVEINAGVDPQDVVRSLQRQLDAAHAECRVLVRQLEQGPPFDAPIEVRVSGPDLDRLRELGSELRLVASQIPQVIHTRSDLEETIPKLTVDVDKRAAATVGLNGTQIAQLLFTTLAGAPAGKVLDGEEELPVRVKLAKRRDGNLEQLAALPISAGIRRGPANPSATPGSATGPPTTTPLGAIATFTLDSDVGSITRIDGIRTVEMKAYIKAGVLPSSALARFRSRLAESDFALPAGYSLEFGGERAERSHAVNSLIANSVILFAFMVLTLVLSFRSFRAALIIMLVGFLAAGLGPLSLWLFGFPFGFMAIVGTMGLVGVAINDSIVVLAAIRRNEDACRGNIAQLTQVVSGCTRHILATTLTTIVGFIPLILSGGGFWPPLVICIATGVGGATVLALYFVPSLSLLLRRFG